MCTLVFGIDVPVRGTLLIAANRDEDPARPSDPPGLLNERPRVVGGRDRVAGGTWLAVREGRAAVAMLNRRPSGAAAAGTRSRGLLALDAAAADGDGPEPALEASRAAVARDAYAPFSLVRLEPGASWILVHDPPGPDRVLKPGPGWHVLTHADLDDPGEPRAAALRAALGSWAPADWNAARDGLAAHMAARGSGGRSVCIHEGPMATVSSALLRLGGAGPRYLHAEGRPCEHPYEDFTHLLHVGGAAPGGRR